MVEQDGSEREAAYPDVGIREKRFALIIRIYVFLAVMAEALLVFINVNYHKGIWWSAITAGVFIYIYLIMKIGIQNDAGYRSKIILLTIFSIGLLFLIDEVAGYRGWSLNYVLPAGVIMLNVAIILLMIVNWRNWPSYLLFQLFCILCSIFPIIYGRRMSLQNRF